MEFWLTEHDVIDSILRHFERKQARETLRFDLPPQLLTNLVRASGFHPSSLTKPGRSRSTG
jgi:hypothetical protein